MKTLIPLTITAFLAVGCSHQKEEKQNIYTDDRSQFALKQAYTLDDEAEDKHILGKSFFTIPWAEAPSATTARDGLGPLYSANTCLHCHPNNGVGLAMENGVMSRSLVMRLSLSSGENINNNLTMTHGFLPEPTYGGQLSIHANTNTAFEGKVSLSYQNIVQKYDDNTSYELQVPTYKITNLQYGALHKDVNIAPHIALALIGLGAIEMIDARDILIHEDVDDRDKDGISGKANWVFNPESNATELGRFTWKAAAASVKQQAANAAHNDMSLSNPLYPGDNCTSYQPECLEAEKGSHDFDLPMKRLDAIAFYLKTLKIPKERKTVHFAKGQEIFNDLGCVKCHISEYKLSDTNVIRPYSDFLLHDMGEALSDGHSLFLADKDEFRTPPLWGIGLYKKISGATALLHDGRARTIEEAILWHGGEASKQQMAFKALSKEKRDYLVEFLKGI